MAVTPTPIFGQTPKTGLAIWLNGSTANTKNDGSGTIGTDIMLAYTAGANGAYIDRIRLYPVATTASTATTATVARIYISTKTSGATANTDTHLWQEMACPSQTADQPTVATYPVDVPAQFRIGANETILFSMHHVAAANTMWECLVFATDF